MSKKVELMREIFRKQGNAIIFNNEFKKYYVAPEIPDKVSKVLLRSFDSKVITNMNIVFGKICSRIDNWC